jgi:transketolase
MTPFCTPLRVSLLTIVQKFDIVPSGIAKRALATIEYYKEVKPLRSPVNRAFTQII